MNKFGGSWTKQKIQIVELYAKAYLQIMKTRLYWSLLYFDGFAGTGEINTEDDDYEITEGVAKKILSIIHPRPFDMYYFVELDTEKKTKLEKMIGTSFPDRKNVYVQEADCNNKLIDLANFLRSDKGRKYKVLGFIDPCGMELNWSSLEALKGYDIDLWILVPTGVGANRLLKRDGNISDAWITRLEKFLGISKQEIMDNFYKQQKEHTLFGEYDYLEKERDSIEKVHTLYKLRLRTIFKFVSDSFAMKNSMNSIMFHFFMATNNSTALKIANDIIKPKFRI